MADPLANASSTISSIKAKADEQKSKIDMLKQQYDAQKTKAETAKKLADTRNLTFSDIKNSALSKISEQKDKAEKAEQRQREYGQAEGLVKSILEKIEQQAKGGKL
jgi:hypothetical protein